MSRTYKLSILALVLTALCVFFVTGSVYADDEAPTEAPLVEEVIIETETPAEPPVEEVLTEAEAPVVPPVEGSLPVEEPLVEQPPLTEQPLAEELPAEAPVEALVVEEPLLAEQPLEESPVEELVEEPAGAVPPEEALVEAAPEESVVLVDEAGEPLTLATEESAELLASGDPYFLSGTMQYIWVFDVGAGDECASVVPLPGYTKVCDASIPISGNIFTPLLAEIQGGRVPSDKKIYVKAGVYTGNITIDGLTSPTTMGVLTGLIGLDGAKNPDGSPKTTINGDVFITGVTTGFTLSGFTINGNAAYSGAAVWFYNNTGTVTLSDLDVRDTASDGVQIGNQGGAVVLTDVKSNNNDISGISIDNTRGVYPVTITNAEASHNDPEHDDVASVGMGILSRGAVTVNGVSASYNDGIGTDITTTGAVSVKNSTFVSNEESGLYIQVPSTAAVTLENVQGVDNGETGIRIGTGGAVSVRNVINFWNDEHGLYITNASTLFAASVSIFDSSFPANGINGLWVQSKGNVLLSGIYNNNSNTNGAGAFIDTCLESDLTNDGIDNPTCKGTGTVTLINPGLTLSEFNDNNSYGLVIYSAGAVTLTGVSANGNGQSGVDIWNNYTGKTGGVTINSLPFIPSATAQSTFNDNLNFGIRILSNGAVAINGNAEWTLRADGNGNTGICIACNGGTNLPSTVILKGIDLENNGNYGIKVNNRGATTLSSVRVNGEWGTHMWTPHEGIVLYNYHGTGGVTLSDVGVSYTGGHGIEISSKGAVSLTRVTTFRTGLYGIFVNNQDYSGTVTLTDVSVQQPHDIGIYILSKGSVTLSGVNAEDGGGMNLLTLSDRLQGTVSDRTWFIFDGQAGFQLNVALAIEGYDGTGLLQLYSLDHDGPNDDGSLYSLDSNLDLGFIYTLPYNGKYFLFFEFLDNPDPRIYDYDLIVKYSGTDPGITPVPAREGIHIINSYGAGNVSISGSAANPWPWVSDNSGNGIGVSSKGTITVKNITLQRNGGYGVSLVNNGSTTPKTVTAADLDIYRSGNMGMIIQSIGAVSLTNIQSNENDGTGLFVDNCSFNTNKCRGNAAVSLLATSGHENYLSNNDGNGVFIITTGLVTLQNINIENNASEGLRVQSNTSLADAYRPLVSGVTLSSVGGYWNRVVNNNTGGGIYAVYLNTYGPVTLANLQVSDNGGSGLTILNHEAIYPKAVTLTNVDVWNNDGYGISIVSKGAVTLNGTASSSHYNHNQAVGFDQQVDGIMVGGWNSGFYIPSDTGVAIELDSEWFHGELKLFKEDGSFVESASNANRGEPISMYPDLNEGDYYLEFSPYETWRAYDYVISVYVDGTAGPTLAPVSYSSDYDYYGVQILTEGDVTIATPAGSQRWWYANNAGWGINIETKGNVKLSGLDVSGNNKYGTYITNTGLGKTTTLTNMTVNENSNSVNGLSGITITSLGAVTLTNMNVDGNHSTGISVDNCGQYTDPADGKFKCKSFGAVTLNGSNNFIANNFRYDGESYYGYGLYITTSGKVSLSNFTVENHPNAGVRISRPATPYNTSGGVTITSSGGFWNAIRNSWQGDGLNIGAFGPVSITRLEVRDSGDDGIVIRNELVSSPQAVTLTDVNVRQSGGDGINVETLGAITFMRVESIFNDGYGAYLVNDGSTSVPAAGVTITDGYFSYNQQGLGVSSKGAVKLLGVGVENNFLQQASISNDYLVNGVTISGYLPGIDRWDEDLYIRDTRWDFEVTSDMDSADFDLGVVLHPYSAPMRVMLYRSDGTQLEFGSTASGEYFALEGETWELGYADIPMGSYYLLVRIGTSWDGVSHYWGDAGTYEMNIGAGSDPSLSSDSSSGVYVSTNSAVTVDKGVRHTQSWFNGNNGNGLWVDIDGSGGNVIIARSDVRDNTGYGLVLYNDGLGRTATFTNLNLGGNWAYNALTETRGAVSWTGGDSGWSGSGVLINNSNFTPVKAYPVTISGVNFHDTEYESGLTIESYGNVSLTGVGAWENGWNGITIDTCQESGDVCTGIGTVVVNNSNGSELNNNSGDGLEIDSKGSVTLTNVGASGNDHHGIAVNNYQDGSGTGSVTLTYTQDKSLDSNGDGGVVVESNGAINLTSTKHLWVNDNEYTGVFLSNGYAPTLAPVSVQGTLLTSVNMTANNGKGLEIHSRGAVTVKNTNTYWNQDAGVLIGNDSGSDPTMVTLTSVVAQENGKSGSGKGVDISASGAVTIFALDSNNNRGDGLSVNTTSGAVSVKKSAFRNNQNGSYGMWIDAYGNVLLDSINVVGNDGGVYVTSSNGTATILGTYFKNEILGHWNGSSLDVSALGNISLTRLDIKDGGGSSLSSDTGSVTLNTVNVLNNVKGLEIIADKNAVFTKVVAMNNGTEGNDSDGVYIQLEGGHGTLPYVPFASTASFTDCAFTGNFGSGIRIYYNFDTAIFTPDGPPKPTLIRTTYFGNNVDGDSLYANLVYND